MLRTFMITLASFVAALVAFSFLMGVSKMDVSIKHEMQRHVVAEPFEAGDVIEVSPDGQRILSVLCPSRLPAAKRLSTEVQSGYYNIVDRSQEKFIAFVRNMQGMLGVPVTEATPLPFSDMLPFVGEVNRVSGDFEEMLDTACFCRIARAVVEARSIACVVEKSLVETELVTSPTGPLLKRRTMGLSFREAPYEFDDLSALEPLCPGLNTAAIAPKSQHCVGQSGFTFDVRAKSRIGLIREIALD
jgi:hypothetical protein